MARIRDLTFLLLGLCALSAPFLGMLGVDAAERDAELRRRELRPAATWPQGQALEGWPRAFERGFADRLALRSALLGLRATLHWTVLRESPQPRMLAGQHGWLFAAGRASLDSWRGARPLAPAEVEGWVDYHLAVQAEVQRWGAEYLVCMAPSKAAVYPEHVDPRFARVGPSRRDQVNEALAAAGIRTLDLLPELLAAKIADDAASADFLYHLDGTHWSGRGERVAAAAVAKALGLPRSSISWKRSPGAPDRQRHSTDSWTRRLYLDGLLQSPEFEWWPEPRPSNQRIAGRRLDRDFGMTLEGQPRVLLLSDSYGPGVARALAGDVPVRNLWSSALDCGRGAEFSPRFVVALYVASKLDWQTPGDLPIHSPELLEGLFGDGQPAGGGAPTALSLGAEAPVTLGVEALTLRGDGEAHGLILHWKAGLDGDGVLEVDATLPAAGGLEIAVVGPRVGPQSRVETTRVLHPGGRARVHLPVVGGPRSEGLRVSLWLDGGAGDVLLHDAALRSTATIRGAWRTED